MRNKAVPMAMGIEMLSFLAVPEGWEPPGRPANGGDKALVEGEGPCGDSVPLFKGERTYDDGRDGKMEEL